MIVFRISGEHEGLALEEIKALYDTYGTGFNIAASDNRQLLVKNDLDSSILQRLAFTHEFFIANTVSTLKKLDEVLLGQGLKKGESFCVRCMGFPDNSKEEKRVGGIMHVGFGNPVDLKNPDVTLHLIKIEDSVAICKERFETDDFNKRDPNKRPYFHPLALSPKLARLFLNLARLKEGDTVLDPFCGSGSILIEASLMGLNALGSDKDREILWGCAQNLESYRLKAKTGEADATDIQQTNLDAIVSDPPYARASKMFDSELDDLYSKFLISAFRALKPNGFLVISVPHDARLAYASVGFEMTKNFLLYVHKSLTRRIYILKKPN